jgi:LysR family glycine cleavage system transcriptional activator
MVRRLPSLNALRAFECAARHASFSLAAAELNVTHAAVSRHIRDLEAWLGAKLFNRTGRGVQLTEAGEVLGRDLTPVFDQLVQATERFAGPARRRQLVISAEVSLAALWLVPRLGGFTTKHPDIDLVLDPANRLVDFAKDAVDLGLRYGPGTWKGVDAVKLVDSLSTPVCSPALVKKGKVKAPGDLARMTLLQEDQKDHWLNWLEAAGIDGTVTPAGPMLKGHLAIAAAEAGQGFALADAIQAGDALIEKRLVAPFDAVIRHHAYYIVRGTGKKEPKAAAAFRSWLVTEIARAGEELRAAGLGHLVAR